MEKRVEILLRKRTMNLFSDTWYQSTAKDIVDLFILKEK